MSTISSSTTSTTAYKVTADTTGTLVIQTGATPTTAVTVDTSQNVGIGQTSQVWDEKLGVRLATSGSGTVGLGVYSVSTTYASSMIRVQAETGGSGWKMYEGRANGGSQLFWVDGSGGAYFAGNVGIGTSSPSSYGSPLSVYAATNPTLAVASGNANAYLRLYSTSDNNMYLTNTGGSMTMITANTERMRIDSSGNVGIGTSTNNVYDNVAAGRPLVVQSSSSATTAGSSTNAITISNSDTTTNNLSQLNFAAITGANASQFSAAWIACQYGARTNGQYPTGQLIFAVSTALNNAPSEAMRIDNSQNLKFNSGYGSVATAYGCRAWVNFNGTGTVAIRASGNVTSITDNGVGDYTVNFTNAMPDANYSSNYSIGELNTNYWGPIPYIYAQTTTSCRVRSVFATGSFYDQNSCNFSVFR